MTTVFPSPVAVDGSSRDDVVLRVGADPGSVRWGTLPARGDEPLATVASGAVVVFDTLSHEGILEDQGRDPIAFFGAQGVAPDDVLDDAIRVASVGDHPAGSGPHVVSRPIAVEGARAGDWLRVDVLRLTPRVPYGVISNRHGKGVLADELPRGGTTVSVFARATERDGQLYGVIDRTGPDAVAAYRAATKGSHLGVVTDPRGASDALMFLLHPFLGIMGVTPNTDEHLNTVPPGDFGGNLDINLLTEGTSLYLPVQVDGAGFTVGDPHFVQGNGEVSLTALEASLTAELRLTVVPHDRFVADFGELSGPLVETPRYWVPTGRSHDLDVALRRCVREAISLLETRAGMDEAHAYAYLSAAVDFDISEAVDVNLGVHACIPKDDLTRR
ncbi:acetamidase/formamidase [Bifidobacterium sp. DSM 109958]|uniref:Acetamidase/formamidase n=1 Tax=Bifidobacterium moraviense TaxID=2675323 RepID=A0A7Y0HZ41_9BIFI|nr:acetamidase/formamidase family protein [Bifidobacterium sp. DSM 109958]NMN01042.1 acetamidase/formamidase [Bifidobacterium sp. DSM 109958]